ncbi:Metallo-peptidase family M12B Reprolysin-like [Zobellia uliginosa]|uniref:Metallo-peptidase family M12B Reprolysin-like n=1 Tax=Zobellia uliginosa TaxID=143224 RepID=A0ABY1KYQ8_9FLAO|nr:hypothetical protein [Zobellia uliginosa]SIS94604.1 Metallo-peptidase family M12B Reprolysin-like [Zobellia uliginosa]
MGKKVLDSSIGDVAELEREITPEEIGQQAQLIPFWYRNSGLYIKKGRFFPVFPKIPIKMKPSGVQSAIDLDVLNEEERASLPILPFLSYEELRLDIDGQFPLMMASGYLRFPGVHYVAKLSKSGNDYLGKIWYRHGNVASFAYKYIKIELTNSIFPKNKKAKVTFYGNGDTKKVSTYNFSSSQFRKVDFEFDYEEGVKPVLSIDTHAHPIRPASLVKEKLTLEKVYQRAGFTVTRSAGDEVPSALKGANGTWSNMEMHDAMQAYWSKFSAAPKWALWTFFAKQHDIGPNLGGIMFDDIGPNHRQGTAIFYDSFINNAPVGDANPAAFVKRSKFWTAAHEMGHAFNLAHSWQKNYPGFGFSWIPLANDPEDRSFMNYPGRVSGGENAFYSDFDFRFTDNELLFMRHAPNDFVEMGNSDWFENHAFEQEASITDNRLSLEINVLQEGRVAEYLEPVYLELTLRNTSGAPIAVSKRLIDNLKNVMVLIQGPNGKVSKVRSFVEYLLEDKEVVLLPDEIMTHKHFISAGPDGWYIKDSGSYKISAMLENKDQVYSSNQVELEVLLPKTTEAQLLANQYFTEEVARVLFFNGSRVLTTGNKVLQKVVDSLPESNVSVHAAMALAMPYMKDYKMMNFEEATPQAAVKSASEEKGGFKTIKADEKKAKSLIDIATSRTEQFAKTYGVASNNAHLNELLGFIKENDSATKLNKIEKDLNKYSRN